MHMLLTASGEGSSGNKSSIASGPALLVAEVSEPASTPCSPHAWAGLLARGDQWAALEHGAVAVACEQLRRDLWTIRRIRGPLVQQWAPLALVPCFVALAQQLTACLCASIAQASSPAAAAQDAWAAVTGLFEPWVRVLGDEQQHEHACSLQVCM